MTQGEVFIQTKFNRKGMAVYVIIRIFAKYYY